MSDDDRIDFSTFRELTLEPLVRDIEARCAPSLAQRQRHRANFQIVAWRRSTLAAALAIALASAIVLRRSAAGPSPTSGRTPLASSADLTTSRELASLLGVPAPLVRRLTTASTPTLSDLVQEVTP